MDRSPYAPWAFILREYHYGSDPNNRFGTLWFYELDTGSQTMLTTPQGTSRGPFVRVRRISAPTGSPVRGTSRCGLAMVGMGIK
jgi:hypothetical protein